MPIKLSKNKIYYSTEYQTCEANIVFNEVGAGTITLTLTGKTPFYFGCIKDIGLFLAAVGGDLVKEANNYLWGSRAG